jgi:hypothetical protein
MDSSAFSAPDRLRSTAVGRDNDPLMSFSVHTHCYKNGARTDKTFTSPCGRIFRSRKTALAFASSLPCPPGPSFHLSPTPFPNLNCELPSRSPGMELLTRHVAHIGNVAHLRSRSAVLQARLGEFGLNTELLRSAAADSVLSIPLLHRHSTASPNQSNIVSSSKPVQVCATDVRPIIVELATLLPEVCFVEMAGGMEAYIATPLAERQASNARTMAKAMGSNGCAGIKLIKYIRKLKEYCHVRGISGPLWPLYPCILSNFAVWLQINSPKEGATSVAQSCISTFTSFSNSIKLPVIIDSPHLGAVPAHQASGDGWTGHLPPDIAGRLEYYCIRSNCFSDAMNYDMRCAHTMWRGSTRTQDWVRVSVAEKSKAPDASVVYKISLTKNGEQNVLFALSNTGINGDITWQRSFNDQLSRFGPASMLSHSDYTVSCNTPIHGPQLSSKDFSKRMGKCISLCAKDLGYTPQQLKDLHIVPHSLHGSFAAYGEALEWNTVVQHKLGRWKLPATMVVRKRGRGAGACGPKTIAAVYSTAASCQLQLAIRDRMVRALRVLKDQLPSHGDMSAFLSHEGLTHGGFRGDAGHSS